MSRDPCWRRGIWSSIEWIPRAGGRGSSLESSTRQMSGFGQYLLATWKGNIGDDDGVDQTNTSRSNSYLLSRPRALFPTRSSFTGDWKFKHLGANACDQTWMHGQVELRPGCRRTAQPLHLALPSFLPSYNLSIFYFILHTYYSLISTDTHNSILFLPN